MEELVQIFLLLGSNQNDPAKQLEEAREHVEREINPILQASKIYLTEAWGKEDQPDFLNQVLSLQTSLRPRELLETIHRIEAAMGRIREDRWGPRPIDIDILFFGQDIIDEPNLKIPHIGIPNRNFTLVPLMEVAPYWEHPILKKNMETLYWECSDPLEVYLLD